jgi:hypothetical protein
MGMAGKLTTSSPFLKEAMMIFQIFSHCNGKTTVPKGMIIQP